MKKLLTILILIITTSLFAQNITELETPLLTHTNDADVNVLEVEHLIKSLNPT